MLSWNEVIIDCKRDLGYPWHIVEYDDKDIKELLSQDCIRKFSIYFPDKETLVLDTSDVNSRVPNRKDTFYVFEPDGREILSLDEFIPTMGDNLIMGHPWWGAFSYEQIPEMALAAFKANNLRGFSPWNYTIKFKTPNKVRITPLFKGQATFEYSRVHAEDLSTIPIDLVPYFKDMCNARFKMAIGSIRKMYSTISTPFGEIPLNGAELYSEGESAYNTLIEKFETSSSTYIMLDIG